MIKIVSRERNIFTLKAMGQNTNSWKLNQKMTKNLDKLKNIKISLRKRRKHCKNKENTRINWNPSKFNNNFMKNNNLNFGKSNKKTPIIKSALTEQFKKDNLKKGESKRFRSSRNLRKIQAIWTKKFSTTKSAN
jgi:hypothetical protein